MQQRTKRDRKLESKKDSRKVRGPEKSTEKKEPNSINEAVLDNQNVEGSDMKLNSNNLSSDEVKSSEKLGADVPEKNHRIIARRVSHDIKGRGLSVGSLPPIEKSKLGNIIGASKPLVRKLRSGFLPRTTQ